MCVSACSYGTDRRLLIVASASAFPRRYSELLLANWVNDLAPSKPKSACAIVPLKPNELSRDAASFAAADRGGPRRRRGAEGRPEVCDAGHKIGEVDDVVDLHSPFSSRASVFRHDHHHRFLRSHVDLLTRKLLSDTCAVSFCQLRWPFDGGRRAQA